MAKENNMQQDFENSASSAEEIMRKYDRESATRIWTGKPAVVVKIILAAFSLYCILVYLIQHGRSSYPTLRYFLGLIIIMGYLTYPASKKHVEENSMPWYDILIMVLGAGSFFYYCFSYTKLVKVLSSASAIAALPNAMFFYILGIIGILCLAELCRRCVGIPILCVVGVLLVYTFASIMGSGQTFQQTLGRVIYTLFTVLLALWLLRFRSVSSLLPYLLSSVHFWREPESQTSLLILPIPLLVLPAAVPQRLPLFHRLSAAWYPAPLSETR